MTWIMVDLETLDTKPTAQILTCGIVKFDMAESLENTIKDEILLRVDFDEQDKMGRTTSDATMDWWSRQSKEAINEAFSDDDRICVDDFLDVIDNMFGDSDALWSQGSFDAVILTDLYHSKNRTPPWKFYQENDLRTLINRMPFDPRKTMSYSAHNALEDARAQVAALYAVFDHFKMEK